MCNVFVSLLVRIICDLSILLVLSTYGTTVNIWPFIQFPFKIFMSVCFIENKQNLCAITNKQQVQIFDYDKPTGYLQEKAV